MSRSKKTAQESPSKILRDVLLSLYLKDDEGYKDFQRYYNLKMKNLIAHYRKILNKK